MKFPARAAWLALLACLPIARAQAGASAYLPVDLAPVLEARVERVMTLAGVPVMTRPIRVDAVLDALRVACERNRALCRQVRAGLAPYLAPAAVTSGHVEAAATRNNALVQPDQHGAPMNTAWEADVTGIARFSEHALASVGGIGYDGRFTPTNTMLSLGGDRAQLDLGYRDHWWSPLRLGSMLISTEAPTMPSATLSSAAPLTRFNLRYEMFLARMSYSNRIEWHNGFTAGHPELAGFHFDIELAPGWSIGASRLLQFGGGARPHSWGSLWRAFVNTTRYDNTSANLNDDQEFGNQQFAVSSTLALPLRLPMSLYTEYAAEDTFHAQNTRFGSSAISAGFYLPQLPHDLQLRYEFSEWQSNWYVHHIYRDGMSNDGIVLGTWAAAWRVPGEKVGGQSQALQLTWDRRNGDQYDLQFRTALNKSYGPVHYQHAHEVSLRASRPWRAWRVGANLDGGRDEFGANFGRVAASLSYTGERAGAARAAAGDDDNADDAMRTPEAVEVGAAARRLVEGFVDAGVFASRIDFEQDAGKVPAVKTSQQSLHLGLGVRRAFDSRNDFGTRIEFDNVDGHLFTALRALDYRRCIGAHFATSFFFGAGRYEGPTPAYGWYGGVGAQWRDIRGKWDLSLDARAGDHMVRNKNAGEPIILWPNTFYTITGASLYLSRRF